MENISNIKIVYFCLNMETSLIIMLSGFLLMYSVNVISIFIDKMYWIYVDATDREEDKNKEIPESCKHLYS